MSITPQSADFHTMLSVPTLFLNLASHDGILAIVTESSVVQSTAIDHRINDRKLVLFFERLLAADRIEAKDLTNIACVIGPGGFTSLRVACAFANALAFTLDVSVCGVHLSDLYVVRFAPPPPARSERTDRSGGPAPPPEGRGESAVWWLHSTKKHELFARGFGKFAERVPEATLMRLDDVLSMIEPGDAWMGELIPEHQTAIEGRGLIAADLRPLEEILPSFLHEQTFDRRTLLPWYGRGW
ncbi:tRNA (adenosine(37)-N6)-threonylcarbamoyltransferase complex dimerization subunit type 1 TsaB [Candidatus Peregrinibacteria bacterium]|nr:tRNA (adenosine(37)-N6)-threonylcarbamoyltransferase complex dimerization subunit type 1 TsaB [Candidatus Peregrinibacteria bacterium]